MTDICHRCGALIPLVGRVHRCVPRDVVTVKTRPDGSVDIPLTISEGYKLAPIKTEGKPVFEPGLHKNPRTLGKAITEALKPAPKVTEIPPDWTYDKPRPVTLPPKPVTLRKAGVTLHSHPDCPVCKARRETNRKRVTKYRANRRGKP